MHQHNKNNQQFSQAQEQDFTQQDLKDQSSQNAARHQQDQTQSNDNLKQNQANPIQISTERSQNNKDIIELNEQRQQLQSSQQSNRQLNKKQNTKSTNAIQQTPATPYSNQYQMIEEYKTSNFKSLLISSRDNIQKKKEGGNKPSTAANGLSHRKSTGFMTDRQELYSRNGYNQSNTIGGSSSSNNGRHIQTQQSTKKPFQIKNGYNTTNNKKNDYPYSSSARGKTSSSIVDAKSGQKLFTTYSGMGLDDYFNSKDDQVIQGNKTNSLYQQQVSQIFHSHSQQQPRINKTIQNYTHQQSIRNKSLQTVPIIIQNQNDENQNIQNDEVNENQNNNYVDLNQNQDQNYLMAQSLNINQNIEQNTYGSMMQSSMYQNSQIQKQINDLCQQYQQTGNQDDIQALKNILINLIQREEEQIRILSSRCDKVRELADMIYADIPLPPQNINYVNQNSLGVNYANTFDPQFPSPINGTPESQYYAAQNTQNYNTLNGQPTSDLAKIRNALNSLSSSLLSASQNEITLGAKLREVEKLNLDMSMLKKLNQNYKDKAVNQQQVIELLQNRVKSFQEENNKLLIHLNVEKRSAQNSIKKVSNLEKRVEFILENEININLNPNDKLRSTLNELLRENESLKRDLAHKNQDIDKLQGQTKKLNLHISRMVKKMDGYKKNPLSQSNGNQAQAGSTGGQNENQKESQIFQKDDIELLKNFRIPQNLNFRIVSLKSDQSNTITDIMELGANTFSKNTLSLENFEKQKSLISLVAQQFISYKDMSERMNLLINQLSEMSFMDSYKDIAIHVNSTIAQVFNAKRCNLWIVDKQCGIFQTFTETGNGNVTTSKCLINKGMISDSFFLKTPINSKTAQNKPLLQRIDLPNQKDECDYVDQALLVPIFCNSDRQQVKAILEISNSQTELFTFDEEYYAIVCSQFLSAIFCNLIKQQIYEIDQKYNNMLFSAYEQLIQQKTRFQFTQQIRKLVKQIFQIESTIFYFVEKRQLVSYNNIKNQRETFSLEHGLAGAAVKDKKSYIIHDIKQSSYFNPLVDISTILPIYAKPFIDKNAEDEESSVIGLLELTLKSKLQSRLEKDARFDQYDGYFGLEEPLSHIIEKFSQLIMNALKCIKLEE